MTPETAETPGQGVIPSENHLPHLVPAEEIRDRLRTLQGTLEAKGIHCAWIDFTAGLYYYSGSSQQGVLLVPSNGDPILFVKKSLERAGKEASLQVQPFPGRKGLAKAVLERIPASGTIGLPMDSVTAGLYLRLKEMLPECAFTDIGTDLRIQRSVKSAWELRQIRAAAGQADTVFGEIAGMIRPGMTELALSGRVEQRLRELGHSGILRMGGSALAMILAASGRSALYPTNFDGPGGGEGPSPASPAGAGWKRIGKEETVLFDVVTEYNGYYSDQSRIFFTGSRLPEKAGKAHDFCLEALSRLEKAMRTGRLCSEIYQELNGWVQEKGAPEGFMGYGENRVKFFGHGVGLELDELPVIADRIDIRLTPGMVVAVEPKAFLKDLGAVGAENTYVVHENGCESLNKAPVHISTIPAS